ncbi:serine carboxypeptidase [Ancylostoma ceylanicum]|uniref:Serine carboxypeptidase n=1 Tax=Ancylostoma ceylanicum TaxID=53326 RepID=A0A0D6LJ03_9BILA|nr:serine carboxypeptidase [Ancylostoma ceylanicum]
MLRVPYNYYQDCYDAALIETDANNPMPADTGFHPEFEGTADLAANTATLINYISTDNQWGYPCWSEAAIALYLNRRDVQDAVHIPQAWRNQATGKFRWTDCNSKIYDSYRLTYDNTNIFFDYVIKYVKTPNFRFLIYSGDTDTVCNYLGDEWHMRDVAKAANLKSSPRKPWHFSRNDQVAGYNQRYSGKGGSGVDITLDVMVVKGAGHMVPSDRPGPAVQMITNFMFPGQDGPDYSSKANVNPNPPVFRTKLADKTTPKLIRGRTGFMRSYSPLSVGAP